MFDFLKKLFGEQKEEKLTINELKIYIDNAKQTEEKKAIEKIESIINSIKTSLGELEQQANNLERAPIEDEEHIEPRIKTIVNSQRQFFSSQTKLMANQINFPNEINLANAKSFADSFNKEFAIFTQKTVKSFAISNHLFHKELELIKEKLKEIDELRTNLMEFLKKEKLEILEGLSNNLSLILSQKDAFRALSKQRQDIEEKQKNSLEKLEETKKSLDDLMKREDFVNVEKDLKSAKSKEKEIINSIESFFSKTERQWMKIAKKHPEHDKDIKLLTKKPLECHETYAKLSPLFAKAIENKELGNEDYSKILKAINEFTPHKLSDLLKQLKITQDKIQDIETNILPHRAKIESITKEIINLEKTLDSLQNKLALIDKELKTPKIDFEQIAEIASKILEKKVVLYD